MGYLPSFAKTLPIAPMTIMLVNGIFEAIVGFALLAGFFTRLAAILFALHLAVIITVVGYNDIAVRDFGLMLCAIAVALNGPDEWSLDNKLRGKWEKNY